MQESRPKILSCDAIEFGNSTFDCVSFWEADLDQKPVLGCGRVLAMATDSRP
jgi:hypothetical protein